VNQLIVEHIESRAAQSKNRKESAGVCQLIRKYKNVVGEKKTVEVIRNLSLKYPKRPAVQFE
jgi:hypothetical protein